MKVSAKKISNKKVIAKKPLTNLYEMNSKYMYRINYLVTMSYRHVAKRMPGTFVLP